MAKNRPATVHTKEYAGHFAGQHLAVLQCWLPAARAQLSVLFLELIINEVNRAAADVLTSLLRCAKRVGC